MTKRIEFDELTEIGQKRRIAKILRELGSNENQVALRLTANEIRGAPGHEASCPIAQYLKEFAGCKTLSVREARVIWKSSYQRRSYISSIVIAPKAIRDFIFFFDRGAFPHLQKD